MRSRRLSQPAPPTPEAEQVERCEFCAVAVDERHGHVADLHDHRLLCVCRPCYLLFGPQGAGGGRYRGVGEDVRRVEDLELDEARWDALRIPVDLVFFFRQSGVEGLLCFYPGPGGATESELDLSAWSGICAANPVVDTAGARRRGRPAASSRQRRSPATWCRSTSATSWWASSASRGRASVAAPRCGRRIAEFFAGLDARADAVSKGRRRMSAPTGLPDPPQLAELDFECVDVVADRYAAGRRSC